MKKYLLYALLAFAVTMNAQNRRERILRHQDAPRLSTSINEGNTSAHPRRMAHKASKAASDLLCDSVVFFIDGEKYVINEYTYDEQGNQILRKDSAHVDGHWYYNYMEECTYDSQGNKTSYTSSSRTYNGEWRHNPKYEYTYNAQGKRTCTTIYYWSEKAGWYYYEKTETIYNTQGLCEGYKYYYYDWYAYDWVLYGKETTTYDAQGKETGYTYIELSDDGVWEDSEYGAYTYNAQGNIIKESYYYPINSQWFEKYRYEYTFDAKGNTTSVSSYYQAAENGGPYLDQKDEYTYDEQGNKITHIRSTGYIELEYSSKYEYTYDAQCNMTDQISYDYIDGEWKPSGSATYYYSSHTSAIEYKVNDTFEYQSGENTLFCRITETAEGGRGKVDIEGENSYCDGPTQNYFSAEKEPKGKLVVPAVVTDPNGDEYNVETIAKNTYYNCRQLKELDLNCKTLGDAAFAYCENVEKVTLGDNVTTFYPRPFYRSGIKSINLNKVTEIYSYDSQPFEGCTNLEEITVPEDNPAFVAVDNVLFSKDMKRLITFPYFVDYASWSGFPEGLEKIEPYAFIYLNTKKFVLPASLGDIRFSYSSAFVNCTVDELYINGKYVSTAAFNNSDIKAVHIGSDVEFIGQINFTGFYTKDIYLHGTSLPDWEYDSTSFYSSFNNCFDATLHVMPGFNLPAKIAADTNKWANFANIVEDVEFPEETSITDLTTPSAAPAIYNLQGQQVSSTYRGIQIKNGKKILVR